MPDRGMLPALSNLNPEAPVWRLSRGNINSCPYSCCIVPGNLHPPHPTQRASGLRLAIGAVIWARTTLKWIFTRSVDVDVLDGQTPVVAGMERRGGVD